MFSFGLLIPFSDGLHIIGIIVDYFKIITLLFLKERPNIIFIVFFEDGKKQIQIYDQIFIHLQIKEDQIQKNED